MIDLAGRDRAARHSVVTGFRGILHQDQSAGRPDGLQAGAAVGACAGEDHADRSTTERRGQGLKKDVERKADALTWSGLREMQGVADDG